MTKLSIVIYLIMLISPLISAVVSADDFKFLIDREQYQYILKYHDDFYKLFDSEHEDDRRIAMEYAQKTEQNEMAMDLHYSLAQDFGSLEDALQWLLLAEALEVDSLMITEQGNLLKTCFHNPVDSLVYLNYMEPDSNYLPIIQQSPLYNTIIERSAKNVIDEISTTADTDTALELIRGFYSSYPYSAWNQAAFYYELHHLSAHRDYAAILRICEEKHSLSAAHAYISSLFLMSPSFRREAAPLISSLEALILSASYLNYATSDQPVNVLYNKYDPDTWTNRLLLQSLKIEYYKLVAQKELYGDEIGITALYKKPSKWQAITLRNSRDIIFVSNDSGELAELNYWLGRYYALFSRKSYEEKAIEYFGKSLTYGSPRNRYDKDCLSYIEAILIKRAKSISAISYLRNLFRYKGITFEDTNALAGKRYTRIAIGDYDNDGLLDLLFNGSALYHNEGNFEFSDLGTGSNLATLNANGGLWADIDKDGRLDIITTSHDNTGDGEKLLRNVEGDRFVRVNERAGDIDNGYPTEGAAIIDIDGLGYPSLYLANYESWQQRSGYPDNFYYNKGGLFSDQTNTRGFLLPQYADNPGLAGRGVAPADFDNDGHQEILVTNYRLDRNMLYKQADSIFVDIAALYGLAGTYKNGYYGHSIGADWGDIDNDGDLDLFIANLAHPRYIDISDVSQLWRNDGLTYRTIGADTLYYWQFTDITASSGITYDELHSDPLFFDADNDGWLDLFITSVYENDRSYLYRNRGDGTFEDVTFLAGARVYNGWGCASGDLNRDGLLDLVVGSGNGTKVLKNTTSTKNRSIILKPIHKDNTIDVLVVGKDMPAHPNSPAFGTRVKLSLRRPFHRKQTLIRELSGGKGTTSQSAPELHFGMGKAKLIDYERWQP